MPTGHAGLMPTLRRAVLAGAADRTDGQLLGAFVADRDADAFGALVRRHGPMVLGVCRRLLADHATADDAFQAVFLVLARRAAAVRPRERVGNWLYGVAYRTALKARAALARRRSREKQVLVMPEPPAAPPRDEWADLRPVLDEELAALPEKLRTPVVLCDLEGRPQREVARALGLPPGTLATRLAAARRTLAQRLTRRGVTLPGGVLAALLAAHGAAAAVPVALARALTGAAEAIASGTAYSELVSAGALHLSERIMRMMTLSKLKALAVAAVVTAALTGGLGLGLAPAHAQGPGNGPVVVGRDRCGPIYSWPPEPGPRDRTEVAFLRRACLDLRGTPATAIEEYLYLADRAENRRAKLVERLLAETTRAAWTVKADSIRVEGDRVTATGSGVLTFHPPTAPTPEVVRYVTLRLSLQTSADDNEVRLILSELRKAARALRTATADDEVVLDTHTPKVGKVESDAEFLTRVTNDVRGTAPTFLEHLYFAADPDPKKREKLLDALLKDPAVASGLVERKIKSLLQMEPVLLSKAKQDAADTEFLKRVTAATRGTAPTFLEHLYFTADPDPKKREKLLDALLKDPAVVKAVGDDFKKRMLAPPKEDVLLPRLRYSTYPSTLPHRVETQPAK